MSQVYNQIGSLKQVKKLLLENKVKDFSSIREVLDFHTDFMQHKLEIISSHQRLIAQEKIDLKEEVATIRDQLDNSKADLTLRLLAELESLKHQLNSLPVTSDFTFRNLLNHIKSIYLKRKIKDLDTNFDFIIERIFEETGKLLQQKRSRLNYIDTDFDKAVDASAETELRELVRKKKIIDEIMPAILGAVGESKVEQELRLLPEGCFLINDFVLTFKKPLYYKEEKSYIKSIQIDHLLVSSAGIFIMETKNWSAQSLANLDLRSPVRQIRRSAFALNQVIKNQTAFLFTHHWGERKLSLRNLIVFINQKPIEEFEYVKILTLNELRGYIEYFKPIMTDVEAEKWAKYLVSINESSDLK